MERAGCADIPGEGLRIIMLCLEPYKDDLIIINLPDTEKTRLMLSSTGTSDIPSDHNASAGSAPPSAGTVMQY